MFTWTDRNKVSISCAKLAPIANSSEAKYDPNVGQTLSTFLTNGPLRWHDVCPGTHRSKVKKNLGAAKTSIVSISCRSAEGYHLPGDRRIFSLPQKRPGAGAAATCMLWEVSANNTCIVCNPIILWWLSALRITKGNNRTRKWNSDMRHWTDRVGIQENKKNIMTEGI